MVSLRLITLTLAFTTWASAALLDATEQKQVKQRFEEKQQSTQTYQAVFRQSLHIQGVNRAIGSIGKIYYKKPDHLLIRFEDPKDDFVLINGDDLYLKKTGQPVKHREVKGDEAGPMGILLSLFREGATAQDKYYDVSMEREEGRLFVILKAKNPGPERPLKITNQMAWPSLELKSIQVQLNENNSLSYVFESPQRDALLDSGVFTPPSSTR